jgi:hypothetical protein
MAQITNESLKDETVVNFREIQNVVSLAIEQGANSVEQVHQKIARLPLKYLERIEKVEDLAKDVSVIQEKTIGHVFNLIREVNTKASDITEDILDKVDAM